MIIVTSISNIIKKLKKNSF